MPRWNRFLRASFLPALLTGLLAGYGAPSLAGEPVQAAPMEANLRDVVISEVAWGGTAASSADEWVELYNTTNSEIDLSGWKLESDDSTPNITLTGIIPAYGYYLIECVDDKTISDIVADQIILTTCSSNLSNSGEVLTLSDGSSTIDTANSGCSGCWYAGSGSPDYLSMERTMPIVADGAAAWISNDGITRNGLAENGTSPINGTPHNSQIDLDLSIEPKSISSDVLFTITVSNRGYGTAANVSVKDMLPSELTFVSYSSSTGVYDNNTGIWTVGSLPTGSSETLDITVMPPSSGIVTNWAEVWTSSRPDPDSSTGDGSTTKDDDDSIKIGSPTLDISNIVNNPDPNVGTNVVFTITVSNPATNPFDASNVTVNASLPSGLSYVSSSSTIGSYSSGIWTIGDLAIGSSATLNLTAKITANNPSSYSAIVTSDNYPDNIATVALNNPLSGEADLSLSHDSIVVSASIPDQVSLKLRLRNDGPDAATGVQVKDLLPSGLDFVSYTSSTGTYNSTSGIWSVDSLASGLEAVLTINVKVDPEGSSTKNFAQVWLSEQYDPDSVPGNGDKSEDDDDSLEVPIADLSLVEKVDVAGSNAVFTITITNSGPDDATGVKVKTSLPALNPPYTFVSSGGTQGVYDKDSGIWDVGGLLDGDSATLTITTATSGSLVVNWVEVSASNQVDPDSVPNNNSKTEDDDSSAPAADLFLTQSVNNPNPDLDTNVVFTITIGNSGIANTTNVQVKDLLPSGLTYVSDDGGGKYNKTSGIWIVDTLASGASKTLNITAKVSTHGVKTNWAEVWKSDEYDSDSTPGNGSTTEDDDASAAITSYRSIIINEIAWSGTAASADDEWIELYNPSNASINITGWTLKSTSGLLEITLSGSIPAGGYFLLERGDNSTVSDINADQIYAGGSSNLLSDAGEILTLRDSLANFIDTANNNGGSWPAGSASGNHGTMERAGTASESDSAWVTNRGNPRNGLDANNGSIYGTPRKVNSSGKAPSPTSTPARVFTQPPLSGKMIINEFLPRAGFDWNQDGIINVRDEFIEIKNLGPVDVSLNGWKLDDEANLDSPPFTIPSMNVKPGQRVVFYASQTGISLSDGGDTVRLLNSSDTVIDAFTYSIAKDADRSWCRIPDIPANGNWNDSCSPTPGLLNSLKGSIPAVPPGAGLEAPLCALPDTLLPDYLFAECNGYGAGIWRPMFWDESGWLERLPIYDNRSKWESFVE